MQTCIKCLSTKSLGEFYACSKNICRECLKAAVRAYGKRTGWKKGPKTPRRVVRDYKRSARHTGRVWALPDGLALDLVSDNCYYCGVSPNPVHGIDRVDNARDYLEDNVVTACTQCNMMKRAMTKEAFESWGLRLGKHLAQFERSV